MCISMSAKVANNDGKENIFLQRGHVMLCHNTDVKRDVRFYIPIYIYVNQTKSSEVPFKDKSDENFTYRRKRVARDLA